MHAYRNRNRQEMLMHILKFFDTYVPSQFICAAIIVRIDQLLAIKTNGHCKYLKGSRNEKTKEAIREGLLWKALVQRVPP